MINYASAYLRPESALYLHKELLSDSMTSAGGFNFFQRMFGHPLKKVNTERSILCTKYT